MTDEAARRRAISESGTRPSLREFTSVSEPQLPTTVKYEKTECECSDNHFPTVVMDKTYDTTLETMYRLLYNSNFMTKFLTDVEMSTGKQQYKQIKEKREVNLIFFIFGRGEYWSVEGRNRWYKIHSRFFIYKVSWECNW
jgi:hypothetical protein